MLQQKSENHHTFFYNARDGIYRSTPDGKFIEVNPALIKLLDYDSEEELLSQNIPENIYYHESERPGPEERNDIFETQLVKKDGKVIWAEINSWVVKDSSDNILYYEGIVRDITDKKRLKQNLHDTKEKLRITLNSIGDGVIATDIEGNIQLINNIGEKLTGWKQKEAMGKPINKVFNIIDQYSRQKVENPVKKVIETGQIQELANPTILTARDGSESAIADSAAPIKDEKGNIYGAVMVFRDVTEERRIREKLKNSERKYRSVFENTGTSTMIIENDTTISEINKQTEILTGYTRSQMENQMSWTELVADEQQKKQMLEYHKNRRKKDVKHAPPRRYEFRLIDKNGEIKHVMISVDIIPGTRKTVASSFDITARKNQEKRIRYLGYHDELTGLYNRHYFKESLERLDTERQLPLSIIMGDVNGLKLINDAFGHQKGDELLKKIADLLKSCCRQEDIISRWGGDEFVVILPQTPEKDARKVIERINNACKQSQTNILETSIALGYAIKKSKEQEIEEILKKAEKMVYQHKLVESESVRSSIISSLVKTLQEKNLETEEHAVRIQNMAVSMGEKLNLPANKTDELNLLACLHDIGKIAISDSILLKPSSLNKEEWETMKKHPEIGYRIAQSSSELAPISEGILHHHEWWNGSGYPRGLSGEEIPLISRIIAIVDAFDVMTHKRPYKEPFSKKEAVEELKRYAGSQFDPHLVEMFLETINS